MIYGSYLRGHKWEVKQYNPLRKVGFLNMKLSPEHLTRVVLIGNYLDQCTGLQQNVTPKKGFTSSMTSPCHLQQLATELMTQEKKKNYK